MDMQSIKTGLGDALKASSRNTRQYRRVKITVPAIISAENVKVPVQILNISQSGALLRFPDRILRFRRGRLIVHEIDREIASCGSRKDLVHVRFAVPFGIDEFRDIALPALNALATTFGNGRPGTIL